MLHKGITLISFINHFHVFQNADKVVVLDVFHRDFAWCVRNTADGYITDIGFKKINLKDTYDHLAHHNQVHVQNFLHTYIPFSMYKGHVAL